MGATFRVLRLPSGMVHYWRLDEVTGATYTDLVGNTDATCIHCPTPTTGMVGGAQTLNGESNELNVVDEGTLDWAADARFSFEFWMKRGSACLGRKAVVGRRDPATSLYWWVGCEDNRAAFYLLDKNGMGPSLGALGTRNVADGAWHHIVAVRDGFAGENRLYVDGVEEASLRGSYTGGFEAANVPLNLGWLNDSASDYHFAGGIDEVAIYNRVLSRQEILRHATDGTVGLRRGSWGCGAPVRIMPLGDSITRRQGYRPGLYRALVAAGYDIDFVGSQKDTSGTHDRNHEGHSGYTPAVFRTCLATRYGG